MLKIILAVLLIVYLAPAALAAILWTTGDHPASWSQADWTSARVLPAANVDEAAAIYILAARTGGLKGALAGHSWVVVKDKGALSYERWDKVGWGDPIRRNSYPADGRWYSNLPKIVVEKHGAEAEALIPKVRAAIAGYPFAMRGGYRIFPGPNSNSFTAYVMRAVPGIDATLPSMAVGRDYPTDWTLVSIDPDGKEMRLSLWGYAGVVVGWKSGLEVNLFGLVAGIDPRRLAIKIPAFGTYGLLHEPEAVRPAAVQANRRPESTTAAVSSSDGVPAGGTVQVADPSVPTPAGNDSLPSRSSAVRVDAPVAIAICGSSIHSSDQAEPERSFS